MRQIRSLHPTLEYDHYGMANLINPPEEAKLVKLDEEKVSAKINNRKQTWRTPKPNPTITQPIPKTIEPNPNEPQNQIQTLTNANPTI